MSTEQFTPEPERTASFDAEAPVPPAPATAPSVPVPPEPDPTPQPAAEQTESAAPAAAGQAAGAGPLKARPKKLRPRTGPVVWGALILVLCAFVTVRETGGVIDPTAWFITTVIGLGVLLLGVGVAVLIRGPRDPR